MSENKRPIVARCDKCQLGYIYMNPKRETVDCMLNICRGTVRRVKPKAPPPTEPQGVEA